MSRKTNEQAEAQSPSAPSTDRSAQAAGPLNGEHWQTTPDETGVLTSSPAMTPSGAPPPPIQTNTDGSTLQMTLVLASEEGAPVNSLISPDMTLPAGGSASSQVVSKQEKAKTPVILNEAGTLAIAGILLVDQNNASVQNILGWQANRREQGDGSAGTSTKTTLDHASSSAHDMPAEPLAGALDGEGSTTIIASGVQNPGAGMAAPATGEIFNVAMDLSLASAPSSNEGVSQSVAKATPKEAPDTISSKNPGLTNAFDAVKNAMGGSGDLSSRNAQSDGQSSQSSQADHSNTGAVTSREPDNGASQLQAQTVAMHVASHGTAATQHAPMGIGDTARPTKQQDLPAAIHMANDEAAAPSGINAAKLIQTMGETEMRVGMHSTEFGDISIRTTISQQQIVTQISLDHNDLSQAISAHVATVQAKLGEDYGLHASIEINNQGSSLSGDSRNSSQQEQRSLNGSTRAKGVAVPAVSDSGMGLGVMVSAGNGYGLDIRI